jgi:hypothetical protein
MTAGCPGPRSKPTHWRMKKPGLAVEAGFHVVVKWVP